MVRRALAFSERADIGRYHTVVWRGRRPNSMKTRGYKPVTSDCKAADRRKRPQVHKLDGDEVHLARVKADLRGCRIPG